MSIERNSPKRRRRALFGLGAGVLALAAPRADAHDLRNSVMERRPLVVANDFAFESRRAAEDFIAETMPRVTAANPPYLTKSDGAETRWLTKSVRFDDAPTGIRVSMDEEFTQTKAGVSTVGKHRAVFSLANVDISVTASADDVTPNGEAAMLILFKCAASKCIDGTWNGQAVPADSTDVSVQDEALRARLLAAFQFLKGGDKSAG